MTQTQTPRAPTHASERQTMQVRGRLVLHGEKGIFRVTGNASLFDAVVIGNVELTGDNIKIVNSRLRATEAGNEIVLQGDNITIMGSRFTGNVFVPGDVDIANTYVNASVPVLVPSGAHIRDGLIGLSDDVKVLTFDRNNDGRHRTVTVHRGTWGERIADRAFERKPVQFAVFVVGSPDGPVETKTVTKLDINDVQRMVNHGTPFDEAQFDDPDGPGVDQCDRAKFTLSELESVLECAAGLPDPN